jgi:hypothetical protein
MVVFPEIVSTILPSIAVVGSNKEIDRYFQNNLFSLKRRYTIFAATFIRIVIFVTPLMNWTQQGVSMIKESSDRYSSFNASAEAGGKLIEGYYTFGI